MQTPGEGMPVVSVLTPSFNQVEFLGDTLRSVQHQSYPNIEHIVMDGGSTDGTTDLLEHRASPRLLWRSEPDKGQSHALNKALALSSGEIIGWLNSDDAYYHKRSVEMAVEEFGRHPEVDVLYGHLARTSPDGLLLRFAWAPPFSYRLLRVGNFIGQPSVLIRRSALGERMVDESFDYCMDAELWLRLGKEGRRFRRLNTVVGVDRQHSQRKTVMLKHVQEAESARLADRYDPVTRGIFRHHKAPLELARQVMGLTLLRHASVELAFDGRLDSKWRLARRQISFRQATE